MEKDDQAGRSGVKKGKMKLNILLRFPGVNIYWKQAFFYRGGGLPGRTYLPRILEPTLERVRRGGKGGGSAETYLPINFHSENKGKFFFSCAPGGCPRKGSQKGVPKTFLVTSEGGG